MNYMYSAVAGPSSGCPRSYLASIRAGLEEDIDPTVNKITLYQA